MSTRPSKLWRAQIWLAGIGLATVFFGASSWQHLASDVDRIFPAGPEVDVLHEIIKESSPEVLRFITRKRANLTRVLQINSGTTMILGAAFVLFAAILRLFPFALALTAPGFFLLAQVGLFAMEVGMSVPTGAVFLGGDGLIKFFTLLLLLRPVRLTAAWEKCNE